MDREAPVREGPGVLPGRRDGRRSGDTLVAHGFRRLEIEADDGTALSVAVGGEGPALLLVHGFTGTGDAWGETLLTRLARDHLVIAPDLPGHGRSGRPVESARYAIDRVIADLVAVRGAFTDRAAVWIGYSMGARIALAAAVSGHARAGLVLESGSPGLGRSSERARRREVDEERAGRLESEGIERFVDGWMRMPLFASQRALPEAVRERERRRRSAQDPRALAACLRGLGTGSQPSFWGELGGLEAPVLVLTGGLDAKFEAIGDRMAGAIPRARRVSVPGAGHAVHLEDPEAWLGAVVPFLDTIGGED